MISPGYKKEYKNEHDADEEKISLISLSDNGEPKSSYENLILKSDSEEDSESEE